MSRRLALTALFALVATSAAAAPAQQFRYTYKGDGFDGQLWSGDDCRNANLYVYGADAFFKAGPGQPATSNYGSAEAYVYDWCTGSQGWAWVDLSGSAVVNARGPNATTSVSGSVSIPMGHYEQGTEEVCWTYEEACYDENWNWCDCAGECTYEYPAGEYCEYPWIWVSDGDSLMGFNLTFTPEGTVSRGTSQYSTKNEQGMYRYRNNGTFRPAIISGTWALDGRDLFATGGGYGSLWNTNGGEMSIWRW